MIQNNLTWKMINWQKVRTNVFNKQTLIYKASKQNHRKKVYDLQRELINSFDSKLMAVRCATENLNTEKNPIFISASQKMLLVSKITIDGLNLASTGTFSNTMQIVEKRAKQMLAKQAFEPEWKAFFELNGYLEKTHYDYVQKVLLGFQTNKPEWVLRIEFANVSEINHFQILAKLVTFEAMEKQIQFWLKKGLLVDSEKHPDLLCQFLRGQSINCLSELLINILFHGLEKKIYEFAKYGMRSSFFDCPITIVRYKTSFVITTENQKLFNAIENQIDTWSKKEIGLLPSKKSFFSSQGFEYLGFQFISIRQKTGNYRIKVRPSKTSKQRFIDQTRQIIQSNKAVSSYVLIRLLSRPILGWANYFYFSECKKDFSQLDSVLFQQIRAWVFRRKSKGLASRTKLKQKYFPEGKHYFFQGKWYQQNWILNGQTKDSNGQLRTLFLPKMGWVTVRRIKCY